MGGFRVSGGFPALHLTLQFWPVNRQERRGILRGFARFGCGLRASIGRRGSWRDSKDSQLAAATINPAPAGVMVAMVSSPSDLVACPSIHKCFYGPMRCTPRKRLTVCRRNTETK